LQIRQEIRKFVSSFGHDLELYSVASEEVCGCVVFFGGVDTFSRPKKFPEGHVQFALKKAKPLAGRDFPSSVFIPGLSQLSCDDIHQQRRHQLPCMRDGSMPQGDLVYQMR
jgi:hypothetical protein